MSAPWVEKHRPTSTDGIILDERNTRLVRNIGELPKIPSLLIHGPPGTGKTTAAEAIISRFAVKAESHAVLRLNASDERGISSVKTTIAAFACSEGMKRNTRKIVLLDEVDYMTPGAHDVLKALITRMREKVSFILICNYLFRVDSALRDCLICMKFYAPPRDKVAMFLTRILRIEGKTAGRFCVDNIVSTYYPDIRSMINACQHVGLDTELLPSMLDIKSLERFCPEVRKEHLRRTASTMGNTPVAAAKRLLKGIILSISDDKLEEAVEQKCNFVKLASLSPELAEDYFCDLLIPNLAARVHSEEP